MSQSPPVLSTAASATPPVVGAANLLKKPAAPRQGVVDSNAIIKKLMDARALLKQISTSNPNHPHLMLFNELLGMFELQHSTLFLFMQQQQALLGAHNDLVQAFKQIRARQVPLEQWMERVHDATVIMDVKVRFPEAGPISTDPFLPLPDSVMEEEKTPSQEPSEQKEQDDGVLTQKC